MGEQARSAPCVAWVNAKKSIHAPSIQPFLFAAGNLRNMTNPFSEYSQFDALTKSFPKIGTIGAYAVCRAAAAGRR